MNLIFDGNYLFHVAFSVFSTYYRGKDMSEVLQDKEAQQVLLRKCIIDLCHTVNRFTDIDRVIITIDSSSWRYNLYANYKYSLTKVRDDYYKYFLQCLYMFEEFMRNKGFIVSRVDGCEGDDLIYIWSLYYGYCENEETVIITGDSDLRQLITDKVSVFCNNSKYLKMYCMQCNELEWNDRLDSDIQVVTTDPFEILLYKVILGDGSDNIPKIKSGFGEKGFQKFLQTIKPYNQPKDVDIIKMASWIADRLSKYLFTEYEDTFGKVLFNLKMVWLNVAAYNECEFISEDGRPLLAHMLDNIIQNRDNYKYKGEYSLENIYGMLIKK